MVPYSEVLKFKSFKDPKAGQAAGQAPPPTAGDAAAGDDEQSQRGARIDSLEKALRQLGDIADDDPAKQCFESQLRDARKAQRDAKPVLQQHTNVAFRLQTAQKKQSKAGEAVAAQQKLIEETQRSLHELQEKEEATKREVAALQEELRRTMPPDAARPPAEVNFELPPEVLEAEGNADVKELMSNPIFAKYQQLFKASRQGQQQDSKVLQVELLMHQCRRRQSRKDSGVFLTPPFFVAFLSLLQVMPFLSIRGIDSRLKLQDHNSSKALKGSAKLMHKITRLQKVWCPTVVEKASGVFSSSPEAVLNAEVEVEEARSQACDPDLVQEAVQAGALVRVLVHVHLPHGAAANPDPPADVMLTGEIQAGERYAFSVYARNPDSFSPGPMNGWMIYTLSSEGYLVDGSVGTLTFVDPHTESMDWGGSATESFSMYRTALNTAVRTCAAVSISNMLPYSISNLPAVVTVSPLCVPESVETTLRIIAPHGFVWDASGGDFSGLPGGVPHMDGNVLLWPTPALYQSRATTTYSFDATIRVPDKFPTSTVNDFIFEFGYNSTTLEGRVSAASVAAPPVRALRNAALDYESNLAEEDTVLIFQIQTTTDIPAGGRLTITGPEGFEFDKVCRPEAAPSARGSPYDVNPLAGFLTFPPDVACSWSTTAGDALQGIAATSVVTVTAGSQGIRAGLYRFQLQATNPPATIPPQADPSSDCGYACCWNFGTTVAQGAILDAPQSIPCFGVNGRMSGGGMPALTDVQARDTARDDRPMMYNPIVFVVALSQDAKYDGTMRTWPEELERTALRSLAWRQLWVSMKMPSGAGV
ncbi:unnamed protein product [Prorocentrum cordatum]|uniref:Subtilisin n=1 Tax=Prorocentrum cordatum TaxID=2364126 RepID=A0ABN9PTG8_9DINO|nr:unnamed protein product [Polarella glacialis]